MHCSHIVFTQWTACTQGIHAHSALHALLLHSALYAHSAQHALLAYNALHAQITLHALLPCSAVPVHSALPTQSTAYNA